MPRASKIFYMLSDLPTLPHPITHCPASIFSMRSPFPILKESLFPISQDKTAYNSCPFKFLRGEFIFFLRGEFINAWECERTPPQKRMTPFVFPTLKSDFSFLLPSHTHTKSGGTGGMGTGL